MSSTLSTRGRSDSGAAQPISLGMISPKDAAKKFNARREDSEKARKSVLTESEKAKKEKEELYKQRKKALKEERKARGGTNVMDLPVSAAVASLGNADAIDRIQKLNDSVQQKKNSKISPTPKEVNDDAAKGHPAALVRKSGALAGFGGVSAPPDKAPELSIGLTTDEDGNPLYSKGLFSKKTKHERELHARGKLAKMVHLERMLTGKTSTCSQSMRNPSSLNQSVYDPSVNSQSSNLV